MSKRLKISLAVLALILVAVSLFLIFKWSPFAKREKETTPSIEEQPISTSSSSPANQSSTPASEGGFLKVDQASKSTSSCVILDEQYCKEGKMVYDNQEPLGLGFKLPVGTKIYTPFKSKIEDKKELKMIEINKKFYSAAVLLDLSKGLGQTRNFFVALGYPKLENKNETLEEGDFLASATSVLVDNNLGDYNLVLTFRSFDGKTGQWQTDINQLKQFFPNMK